MSESKEDHESSSCHQEGNRNERREYSNIGKSSLREKKRFPPALPLLSQTGSSTGHMPWFLRRSYTDNGRLILQEVKVKHRKFFRACRVNGRLTLRLMHPSDCNSRNTDDDDDDDLMVEEAEEEEEEEEEEEPIVRDVVENSKRVVGLSLVSSSPSPLVPLLLKESSAGEWKLGRRQTLGNLCSRIKKKEIMSRAASSPSLLSLTRPESPRVCFPMRRTGSISPSNASSAHHSSCT